MRSLVVSAGFVCAAGLPLVLSLGAGQETRARSSPVAGVTTVYENNDFQLTGVTMSRDGRMFVNFPRWSDKYLNAVVEVQKDGSARPYPDEYWNRWDKKPENYLAFLHFACGLIAFRAAGLFG